MLPSSAFADLRHSCSKCSLNLKGVEGEAAKYERRQYIRTAAEIILRESFSIIVRLVSEQITGEECLRNELVLAWQVLDSYNHADTACCQFVKSLRGNRRASEIIVTAEHEVCR